MALGTVDLSGWWRACLADDESRRDVLDGGRADEGWERIAVPGHWRSHPAFADSDGPVLYRSRFETPADGTGAGDRGAPAAPHRRWWLTLDGAFVSTDVWLDGTYLGDTEGYFFGHTFEVGDVLAARREHDLAVEVACPPERDRARKRHLTGVFGHWDRRDADANPGGLWRPVRLESTGPVRLARMRVLCRDVVPAAATLALRVELDAAHAGVFEVRTTVVPAGDSSSGATEHRQPRTLAAGVNHLAWTVTVGEPHLWWPWSLGEQPRYDVTVEVRDSSDDTEISALTSDRRSLRTGLRTVHRSGWVISVNGERLFCKGTNLGPTRLALAEASDDELRADVALVRQAGLDLARIHGHVTRPALYDAADEAGVLVWQDLPLQWGYARSVKAQARRQAAEAVNLLGHHPSVITWCGHNEPFAIDIGPGAVGDRQQRRRLAVQGVARTLLPTWNKTVLDHAITHVLEREDGTRPVVAHSGVLPHPPRLDGTDSHLYLGWYLGEYRDLERLLRIWPRLARFVSEFGAQAVPDDAAFLEPQRWPDLDWERAARHHALDKTGFDRHVPPAEHATFESWVAATQAYQAEVVRHAVETLRRLKYRPTGGFAQFCLADGQPAVGWAVLDVERRPKAAWAALRDACRPVLPLASWPPVDLRPGEDLAVELHVTNDRHIDFADSLLTVDLSWESPDGEVQRHVRRWSGDVAADDCIRVGTFRATAPASATSMALELTLTGTGLDVTNRYHIRVSAHHDRRPASGSARRARSRAPRSRRPTTS
jgi:beta-mannosidase